ncbi:MAG: cobalamin biosynthesis protein [Thermodesulfobacteriota bacterium]
MKRLAVYALTPQGAQLGKLLADRMGGDLFLPAPLSEAHGGTAFDRIIPLVSETFPLYPRHVFITATGIAVRAIAPHLRSKGRDPAVVSMDQRGRFVVSLVSGHLGGANRLARVVAELTGGVAVITTATDTEGFVSFDLLAEERGLVMANPEAVKAVNMALLKGEGIQVFDPENRLGLKEGPHPGAGVRHLKDERQWQPGRPGLWVTWKSKDPEEMQLVLHPRSLIAGVGCNRGTGKEEVLQHLTATFRAHNLSLLSLGRIVTIQGKRDEPGLLEAAGELEVPVGFVHPSELETVPVPHPSGVVRKHMGVSSVCEAAALHESGAESLLVPKTKSRNVTLAVALEGFS